MQNEPRTKMPRWRLGRWAALLAISLLMPLIASGEERVVSKYTSTARAKALSFKEHNGPGGGFEAVFAGHGGYQLLHLAGDERSWINIRHGKRTADLYSQTMAAGPGSFPQKENNVVEWRGVEANGRFTPYAIIYRLSGTEETGDRVKTRLIVIKLDKERSKIIGHAEGANEDAKAKQLADTVRPR